MTRAGIYETQEDVKINVYGNLFEPKDKLEKYVNKIKTHPFHPIHPLLKNV